MTTNESVSIVVCSRNGASVIRECIEALIHQTTPAREVIVVSDGSTDETVEIAQSFGVRVISLQENQGLSFARNVGIENATGSVLAFTDDDVRPCEDWVARLVSAWNSAPPHVKGIGGVVEPTETNSLNGFYAAVRRPLKPIVDSGNSGSRLVARFARYLDWNSPTASRQSKAVSLVGANMTFRRTALMEIGGFNHLIRFGGDEEYVCAQIADRFGPDSLIVEHDIVVKHEFGQKFRDSLRRAYAYGRGASTRASMGAGPWPVPSPVALVFFFSVSLSTAFNSPVAVLTASFAIFVSQTGRLVKAPRNDMRWLIFPILLVMDESSNLLGMATGTIVSLLRGRGRLSRP